MEDLPSNKELVESICTILGCDNPNQLAKHIREKYGVKMDRQSIYDFGKRENRQLPHFLLLEILEKYHTEKGKVLKIYGESV